MLGQQLAVGPEQEKQVQRPRTEDEERQTEDDKREPAPRQLRRNALTHEPMLSSDDAEQR
jgi:hypothetical protein